MGVFIYESATPLLESNVIKENSGAGVVVAEGAAPVLRQNVLESGNDAGMVFHKDARGEVRDNNVFNHRTYGVAVLAGSQPTMTRNWFHGRRQVRVAHYLVYDSCQSGVRGRAVARAAG